MTIAEYLAEVAAAKATWGPGPWQSEPDRVDWRAHGFPCFVQRAWATGAWCGYAGVTEDHPLYGMDLFEVPLLSHCGVTFAEPSQGAIAYEPWPGEPEVVWWFGFDCAHGFDVAPALNARLDALGLDRRPEMRRHQKYRHVGYATLRVYELAAQLDALRGNEHPAVLELLEKQGVGTE